MNSWLALPAAVATLVVNEVLYDPPGADGGREFVELYSATAISLQGFVLEAGDGARSTWRVVWRGQGSIAADAFFVIGGDSVAGAGGRLAGELQNGPDALRLVDPGGVVVDRVGWGALEDPTMFEGEPASDAAGRSLARDQDGVDHDDNRRDFVVAIPSPGRRNRPRRDLALSVRAPDPLHAWPGRLLRAVLQVQNRGIEIATGWNVHATWARESDGGVTAERPIAIAGPIGAALAPGDSAELVLGIAGELGVFRFTVRGAFADDDSTGDTVATRVRVGAGDLIIDEILYAPRTGEPEWFELWNRGSASIRPAGHTVTDASGRRATLRGGAALAAGARGVVSADTTSAIPSLAPGTPRFVASPWPSLNDTGEGWADALVLRDATGAVTDACGYPPAARERGRSLERLAADPDVRGVGWIASQAEAGCTPGAPNSIAQAPQGPSAVFECTPNPFAPGVPGGGEQLAIRAVVPPGYDGCRVEVFDLEGRSRARLLTDALGPGPRVLGWDGVGDGGALVEAGAYIIFFECHSKAEPRLRIKRALGVVRP